MEKRIPFKIKTGYYLELLTPKTMKLLESTKNKITKEENGENVPLLEVAEVVLIHCNVVNDSYQQNSKVLHTFVPNKSFGQLWDISPENVLFLKTFNSEQKKEQKQLVIWLVIKLLIKLENIQKIHNKIIQK